MGLSASEHTTPFLQIYERYVDEASFLWVLRKVALEQPHYSSEDLMDLENRIEQQLDGIMTAPEDAWAVCEAALDLEEPGEVFAATVTALRCLDVWKIQKAVEHGLKNEETFPALVSAFAWVKEKYSHTWIKKFFKSKNFDHKRLALNVCTLRGENPLEQLDKILEREDCRQNKPLYAQAIQSIGEFKRTDLSHFIPLALQDADKSVVFSGLWSSVMLGDQSHMEQLKQFVIEEGEYQQKAIEIAFRVLPIEKAREWISLLAAQPNNKRQVIVASRILGDPQALPWVIAQMQESSLARVAGETFSVITGIDLVKYGLATDIPDLDEKLRYHDDDAFVGLDDDENLPFPTVEKIAGVWQKYGQYFSTGKRYFMGHPIAEEYLLEAIQHGKQRQRHAAALELALLDIHQPYINTRAKII